MRLLFLRAFARLILFDFYFLCGNFKALHEKVRKYPIRERSPKPDDVQRICAAVDMACIWYYKVVTCLHRAAVTACLLRDAGAEGQMVSGTQQVPFKSHAWVEVKNEIVNDKPYVRELFAELDRC